MLIFITASGSDNCSRCIPKSGVQTLSSGAGYHYHQNNWKCFPPPHNHFDMQNVECSSNVNKDCLRNRRTYIHSKALKYIMSKYRVQPVKDDSKDTVRLVHLSVGPPVTFLQALIIPGEKSRLYRILTFPLFSSGESDSVLDLPFTRLIDLDWMGRLLCVSSQVNGGYILLIRPDLDCRSREC